MTSTGRRPTSDDTAGLDVPGGRIAYQVIGNGPLIVLSPGLGDRPKSSRTLAPSLVHAGYRVASVDQHGHGDSSTGGDSINRADAAGDLLALIRHLGGPAVVVGRSLSGGAATTAAARAPELVSAIVEINPFGRMPKNDLDLSNVRCPALILIGTADPGSSDPVAEGEAIVAALPAGLATLQSIEATAHHRPTGSPDAVADRIINFLADRVYP